MLILPAYADSVPVATAKKLATPPTIDGVLSPGEWDAASKIEPFLDRANQRAPKDLTEAWLGFDKEKIYAAFYCHDTEPDKIIGREQTPNASFQGEDTVTFSFNPYGTRSWNGLCEFEVNAIGTQRESIAGGRSGKREWRGTWLAKTSRVADGWICELAIPWTMLNYPPKSKINFDLNLIRKQGRSLFQQSWANVRPNPLPELMGIWQGLEPPTAPKPKIQYLAYSAAEFEDDHFSGRFGLDARYPLTGTVNAQISVAPDFRNIEDVIAGVDFVRTERFLNESRPFFQEGGGFFNLLGGFSFGTMFYSRRIGNFDVGARTYGQVTPTLGVGTLYVSNFDGQKALVANISKTISSTSNSNVYATSNTQDGVTNSAFGANFSKRWNTVSIDLNGAVEKNNGEKADSAGAVGITYQRPNVFATAKYIYVEPEFAPALAYIPWTDRRGGYMYAETNRDWRTGPWRDYGIFGSTSEYRTFDGVLQQGGYDFGGHISSRNDVGLDFHKSRYTFSGSLDDTLGGSVTINQSNRFRRYSVGYLSGTQGDLPSTFYNVNISQRIKENLDVNLKQSILELDGTSRQTIVTLGYQPKSDVLISGRAVVSNDGTNVYMSYRKAGLAGTELYVILGDPNAATTQRRMSLKLVWAF